MCGIAGIVSQDGQSVSPSRLQNMLAAIRHRGPDGQATWCAPGVGLAHARLSVLDAVGGAQPMANGSGTVQIVFNGELFNYGELREELRSDGWIFRTRSDTEVLLRAYEAWGPDMLSRLNGQFAFAIWDSLLRGLMLARDRFGILPLFYSVSRGRLVFASEVKGIFGSGLVDARPDPRGLDEAFTCWGARPPRTTFEDVRSLEPASFAWWRGGDLQLQRYYEPQYGEIGNNPAVARELLDGVLRSSVGIRTHADVPVGAYLSGGLDSSITASLAAASNPLPVHTFSIGFDDESLDERAHQVAFARHLRSHHIACRVGHHDVAEALPAAIWHAETPLLRTAPAPMFLLSKLVRDSGLKVVLSGEGADEIFLGYDLFKETVARLAPNGSGREAAPRAGFEDLYPELPSRIRAAGMWREFFSGVAHPDDPLFSHMPRFTISSRLRRFYAPDFRERLGPFDPLGELRDSLPAGFASWTPLSRAAWLEMHTFLSPYLLSAQGDRMAMAHGVELRVPFLDHRLFEFAAALPAAQKLRDGLDKALLREWAERILPAPVAHRPKQAYRAPVVAPLLGDTAPDWVADILSPGAVRRAGVFDPKAVDALVRRCRSGVAPGEVERQALVAVVTTGLWHSAFVEEARFAAPVGIGAEPSQPEGERRALAVSI